MPKCNQCVIAREIGKYSKNCAYFKRSYNASKIAKDGDLKKYYDEL